MTTYELSKDAEEDLREVALYTLDAWGKEQLTEYRQGLKETFNAIGIQDVVARKFSKNYPQLRVTKYRYHYIFYIAEAVEKPIIIGIIHERRDIVNQLARRLT